VFADKRAKLAKHRALSTLPIPSALEQTNETGVTFNNLKLLRATGRNWMIARQDERE
jgi:hypothetical protein